MIFTFEIADNSKLAFMAEAICYLRGYQADIVDPVTGETKANPMTKAQFARREWRMFPHNMARRYDDMLKSKVAEEDLINIEVTDA